MVDWLINYWLLCATLTLTPWLTNSNSPCDSISAVHRATQHRISVQLNDSSAIGLRMKIAKYHYLRHMTPGWSRLFPVQVWLRSRAVVQWLVTFCWIGRTRRRLVQSTARPYLAPARVLGLHTDLDRSKWRCSLQPCCAVGWRLITRWFCCCCCWWRVFNLAVVDGLRHSCLGDSVVKASSRLSSGSSKAAAALLIILNPFTANTVKALHFAILV